MGDIADDHLASLYDDTNDEEYEPEMINSPVKYVKCRNCNEPLLTWGLVDTKWRLFKGNKLHNCSVKPLPT